jgi:hypothetical protein
MAIQDFVTGQVLTATQMDNLQANDYNQTVSAKVASYVLVAADKGTRVTMSNAGATTITVNTALFAAGDTLFITNIGAGACTITAGTATVSTASSLVLAQYDSGRLYFTSTGVAIWEKYQGAASSSAFKGCLLYRTGLISTTGGVYFVVPFDNESVDTNNFHDNVTNNTRVTIPAGLGGKYLITSTWGPDTYNSATSYAKIKVNGADITTANGGAQSAGYLFFGGSPGRLNGSGIFTFTAGDYFEMFFQVDTTNNNVIIASLAVTYLGA